MKLRTCPECGRAFKPGEPRQTRCDDHDNRAPSPSTIAARDPEYRRNRLIVLAGNPNCHWGCGRRATSADHLVAVANGGSNALSNLVPACEPCNKSRRANRAWTPGGRRRGAQAPGGAAADPAAPARRRLPLIR